MPHCHCVAHRCAGALVDDSTLRRHQKDSRRLLQERVQVAGSKAVEAYEARIEQHLLEETLSNSKPPGRSHLWARSPPQSFDLSSLQDALDDAANALPPSLLPSARSSASPPSHSAQVRNALDKMTGLECQIDLLTKSVANICDAPSDNVDRLAPLNKSAAHVSKQLQIISVKAPAITEMCSALQAKLSAVADALEALEEGLTPKEPPPCDNDKIHDSAHHFAHHLESTNPALQVLFFVVIALMVLFCLPHRAGRFLLEGMHLVLQFALTTTSGLRQQDKNLLAGIPVDPDSIFKHFDLDGRHTIYAVCPNPTCHATYAPKFADGSPIASYPRRCTRRAFNSPCHEYLSRNKILNGKEVLVPIKTYVHFDFKDWLSRLLSRPGIEEKLDASWSTMEADELRDVFDGSVLKEFQGPDGQHFSYGGEEGRYVFSLCCDFFNPLGNKQAGKKASTGMIALVCLNLPPDLRYKPENMFLVGVVPGPKEPPLDCINHYLAPLVTDLLDFWDTPVHFSRTHAHPKGRSVRCALVPVVCDLPGAWKVAGFAAFSHKFFCTICHCCKDKEGYVNTPFYQWRRRTNNDCREAARKYAAAPDDTSQKEAFNECGVRCSELLRLPYFDPSRFVVVDAMHNLFLGLVHEHCTGILGLGQKKHTSQLVHINLTQEWQTFPLQDQKSVSYLHSQLEGPLSEDIEEDRQAVIKRFERKSTQALAFVARSIGVYPEALDRRKVKKIDITEALITWRAIQKEVPPTILSGDVLKDLRADIEAMKIPSWVQSIPKNIGDSSHGKLKAAQWRSLGMVYMPASLIRLWGVETANDPQSQRQRRTLEVTMSLLSAISVATSDTTSLACANIYLQHIQAYVDGIKELYPEYSFRPNHHMAFHIAEYLRMYGPVRGWWVFPFERMIGVLQRIPTNHIQSQYEETIAKSYTRAANLRSFLQKLNCPPALKNADTFFQRLLAYSRSETDSRGLLRALEDSDATAELELSHKWDGNTKAIPKDLGSALRMAGIHATRRGVLCSHFVLDGINYTLQSKHQGNSQIILKKCGTLEPTPALIDYILLAEDAGIVKTFLGIRRLKPLQVNCDPFANYPFMHLSLHARQLNCLEIISPDQIHTHYASLNMDWEGQEATLAISLDRS